MGSSSELCGALSSVGMMREMGLPPALPDVDRDEAKSSSERRVVVTGLGAVTPLGSDIETTWRRLVAGECASSVITAFAPAEQPVRIACEVGAFEPGFAKAIAVEMIVIVTLVTVLYSLLQRRTSRWL